MNRRTTLLHMYHSHAFVLWTVCLQTLLYWVCHGFCGKKKKDLSVLSMLSVSQNNQHFSIISVGGESEGFVVVFSLGHCTRDPYRPLLLPPAPLAVCPGAQCSPSATEEISYVFTPPRRQELPLCFTVSLALCFYAEDLLCGMRPYWLRGPGPALAETRQKRRCFPSVWPYFTLHQAVQRAEQPPSKHGNTDGLKRSFCLWG